MVNRWSGECGGRSGDSPPYLTKSNLTKLNLTKPLFSTVSEIKQLTDNPFDDDELKVLGGLYDLGFRCRRGEEKELSKWFDGLWKEFNIDQAKEIVKFKEYWEAQNKKLKTHKLSWRNWLTNAVKYKK